MRSNTPTGQRSKARAYASLSDWLTSTLAALAPTHQPDGASDSYGREHVQHALAQYPGVPGSLVMSSVCRYVVERADQTPQLGITLTYITGNSIMTVETVDGITVRADLPQAVCEFLAWQQHSPEADPMTWLLDSHRWEFGASQLVTAS